MIIRFLSFSNWPSYWWAINICISRNYWLSNDAFGQFQSWSPHMVKSYWTDSFHITRHVVEEITNSVILRVKPQNIQSWNYLYLQEVPEINRIIKQETGISLQSITITSLWSDGHYNTSSAGSMANHLQIYIFISLWGVKGLFCRPALINKWQWTTWIQHAWKHQSASL